MPQSPYCTTIYPPINDLEEYRHDVRQGRIERDQGWVDCTIDSLGLAESLLEHCDFLEDKLDARVSIYFFFTSSRSLRADDIMLETGVP